MATTADKARPSDKVKNCAVLGMTSNPIWNRGFTIKADAADPAIVDDTPPTGMRTTAKSIDWIGFWISATPASDQHSVARIPPPKSPAYPRPS